MKCPRCDSVKKLIDKFNADPDPADAIRVLERIEDLFGKSFECPKCGAISHNPYDKQHGYCGSCHEFTG